MKYLFIENDIYIYIYICTNHKLFYSFLFISQFSVPIDKPYKWNIAGLSEQKIISHMSEVDIAHQNNYDIDKPDTVDLLVNDFSSTLYKWHDLYPTKLPIFAKHIGYNTLDCDDLNIPIYTIPKYVIYIPSNISPRVSELSNIFRCSTMIGYKWYQDRSEERRVGERVCT